MSRQDFPRKIGHKVRGVSKTHGYCHIPFACSVCGILALDVAGPDSQLCIADYKYRNAAGKNYYFNWFAHLACTHTYLTNFYLKRALVRAGKWSAINSSPAWKYTCPRRPGNRFFQPCWLWFFNYGISSNKKKLNVMSCMLLYTHADMYVCMYACMYVCMYCICTCTQQSVWRFISWI